VTTIRGLIFDYGGVLWDMRLDITHALEQEHGLRERAIAGGTLYGSETLARKLEVGVGDREVWLQGASGTQGAWQGASCRRCTSAGASSDRPGHRHSHPEAADDGTRQGSSATPTTRFPVPAEGDARHAETCSTTSARRRGHSEADPRIYTLAASRLGLPAEECVASSTT
jgi:hypothetical protein